MLLFVFPYLFSLRLCVCAPIDAVFYFPPTSMCTFWVVGEKAFAQRKEEKKHTNTHTKGENEKSRARGVVVLRASNNKRGLFSFIQLVCLLFIFSETEQRVLSLSCTALCAQGKTSQLDAPRKNRWCACGSFSRNAVLCKGLGVNVCWCNRKNATLLSLLHVRCTGKNKEEVSTCAFSFFPSPE